MKIALQVLACLVAVEFFYIMYLETFATTSKKTAEVFQMDQEELSRPSVNTLFKNQGIYNGLLAVLTLIAAFALGKIVLQLVLAYMILVAAYGAVTSQPKILLMQGGLPILTLIVGFFA
jgi:putative membrane protein